MSDLDDLANMNLTDEQLVTIGSLLFKRYNEGYDEGCAYQEREHRIALLKSISVDIPGDELKIGDIVLYCDYCYHVTEEQSDCFMAEMIEQEHVSDLVCWKDSTYKKVSLG